MLRVTRTNHMPRRYQSGGSLAKSMVPVLGPASDRGSEVACSRPRMS